MMNKVLLIVLGISFATSSFAKEIKSGEIYFRYEVPYKVLEVSAKCTAPKHEDDTWSVYYEKSSFAEVQKERKKGFDDFLIEKDCSHEDLANSLSKSTYETVHVLMVPTDDLNSAWKKQYREFLADLVKTLN